MNNVVTITVQIDDSCDMASVYDDLGNGMCGNFWDFHNGCHGLYQFDDFKGVNSFVNVLRKFHENKGKSVRVERSNFSYE